jgi:hypothetical protein
MSKSYLLSDWHRKRPPSARGRFLFYGGGVQIEILCFGAMREFLPDGSDGRSAAIDLADGASVGDAVDVLGAPRRLVHAILVNDEPGNLARPLRHGDRLTLMPHYSGG